MSEKRGKDKKSKDKKAKDKKAKDKEKEPRCVLCHKLLLNNQRHVCIRCNLKCRETAEKAAATAAAVAVVAKNAFKS